MRYNLKWGAFQVRWDIFETSWRERDWVYPPVEGKNGFIGSATTWVGVFTGYDHFDPATNSTDDTVTFPQSAGRAEDSGHVVDSESWWFGKLGNGSQIALGNYK